MSSGKTSALGLSQWALTDPFLMAEMNANNQKIDAAVAILPIVKLGHIETTAAADRIDIDMSTIDWSKYRKVSVCYHMEDTETASNTFYSTVRANGRSGSADYYCFDLSNGTTYNTSNSNRIYAGGEMSSKTVYPAMYYHLRQLDIYPAIGCAFVEQGIGPFEKHTEYGSYLYTSSSDIKPLPIAQLSSLNFGWLAGASNSTATTNLAAGCTFDLYGVLK